MSAEHGRGAAPMEQRVGGSWAFARLAVTLIGLATVVAACAPKTIAPPPVALAPAHPEFVFPAVPESLRLAPGADQLALGWRSLQGGDLAGAARVFTQILTVRPDFYPARTAEAYVSLARLDYDKALQAFDAALAASKTYPPALVGKGQALLALSRAGEALAAFEAAQAADRSLDLGGRIDVLRFRSVQALIEAARASDPNRSPAEARRAYEAAIAASPESAFLYRELGLIEADQGQVDAALRRLRQAIELDASDAVAWLRVGDLLAGRGDFVEGAAAYRAAAEHDPGVDVTARIAAVTKQAYEATLPAEFRAIPGSPQLTRGALAALIGERLGVVVSRAPARQVVVTDTRGHWASSWIALVVRAGVLDPFEDHTFQPEGPVRRSDLASAVSRVLAIAAVADRTLATRLARRSPIADMSPAHRDYPAVSAAVASGVMLLADDRFLPARAVTGQEAVDTVDRLAQLTSLMAPAPR